MLLPRGSDVATKILFKVFPESGLFRSKYFQGRLVFRGLCVRDNIGDETLVARDVFAGDDGGLCYPGLAGEGGFDLAGLDAEAADLDLADRRGRGSMRLPSSRHAARSPLR